MLTPYRSLLATPGARRFMIGSGISRLGGAMFGIAVVAMISDRRDSYGLAGAVSAVGLVVLALCTSPLGRLIDRFGQARITMPLIVWSSVVAVFLALASWRDWPVWMLFVGYGLSSVIVEAGAMSRARWAHLLADEPEQLHTAMSLEQVVDELTFVLGPALGAALAATVFPEAGFIAASVLYAVGLVYFLLDRDTEPPVAGRDTAPTSLAIRNPAVVVVALVMLMIGSIFGANEVVTLAFAGEHGHKGLAGILLALFALGSGTAAVVVGARPLPGALSTVLMVGAGGMFVLELPILLVSSLPQLAVVLLIAGIATAPTLITSVKLAQALVPPHQITESMGLVLTGLLVGIAGGSAVAGVIIERFGAHAGYYVPVVSGLLAFLLAAGFRPLLRRTPGFTA